MTTLRSYVVADYVNTNFVEPFGSRLLGLLDFFGGRAKIVSGVRTNAEQWVLWRAYQNGTGNLAAYPGTSRHETRRAADLRIIDGRLSWVDVHREAAKRGLVFPIVDPPEEWHVETDLQWEDEDDMTDEQITRLANAIVDGIVSKLPDALDGRPRQVRDYGADGAGTGIYKTNARQLEEFTKDELTALRWKV